MRIELIRNARVDRSWPSTDRLIADLTAARLKLQPGDKLFVKDDSGGSRSHLRLVEADAA